MLDLTNNELTGAIPQWWGSFSLSKLMLAQNQLTGEFFTNVYSPHLQSLQEVRLESNKLVGELDGNTIMQMQNLETLSLSSNDMSGLIPGFQLGSLSTLKFLYLDNNNFVGPLPSQLAQTGKSQMEELWLQGNSLSGTVPSSFVRFDMLHDFFIDGNKLTGAIPLQLCSSKLNKDFFDGVHDDAERNYCEYIACPVGTTSAEGVYPCSVCPGGDAAKLQNPYLGNSDDCSAYSQRDILRIFYQETSKNGFGTWSGGADWGDSSKDVCQMTGITCDDHENIIKIGLKNRNLAGTIPDVIGYLPFLETLDLSDNNLEGFLPSDLRWTSLTRIDISGNKLRGVLPPMLCMMQELNGNGENNVYYCDRIACPAGTFNSFGHHGYHGEPCQPCYDVQAPGEAYIGQKTCTNIKGGGGFDWKKEIESLKETNESLNLFSKLALSMASIGLAVLMFTLCTRFCANRGGIQRKQERKQILRQAASYESGSSSSGSDDEEDQHRGYSNDVELADQPRGYSDDVDLASLGSKNAMDLINDHKGIALSRPQKVKKAISKRLPQAEGVRTSFSNINVAQRKKRLSRDQYDNLDFGDDDDDEYMDEDEDDEEEDVSSVQNNFGGEGKRSPQKKQTDLLDIPMIS